MATSTPDGHTILGTGNSLAISQVLFPDLPHRTTSFTIVAPANESQQVLAALSKFPFKSVNDLLNHARKTPGELAMASPSYGTTGQLGVLLLQDEAKVKFNPFVYKNATAASKDLVGGHADGIIVTLAAVLPLINDKILTPLAVSSETRTPVLPNVPTFKEAGLPKLTWTERQGFAVPAGTPKQIAQAINTEINAVLKDPATRQKLEQQGFTVRGGTLADGEKRIKVE